jgi:hypothetical protein
MAPDVEAPRLGAEAQEKRLPEAWSNDSNASEPTPLEPRLRPNTKRASVLRIFLERGDAGMNCFEAVSVAHDYVLRSTISDLYRGFGITFNRKYEQVPGHAGSKVECVRYWLSPEGEAKARKLLAEAA